MEVDRHGDLPFFGEGLQINDGDGIVIVPYTVPPRVRYVEFISEDSHLFRLVTDGTLPYNLERGGIDLGDIA